MVEADQHRPAEGRPQALEADARERRAGSLRSDAANRRFFRSSLGIPSSPRGQPSACIMAADMLIKLALAGGLFHTSIGTAFADLPINGHRETWPIRSKRFRWWLRSSFYDATGVAPSAAAIPSALD